MKEFLNNLFIHALVFLSVSKGDNINLFEFKLIKISDLINHQKQYQSEHFKSLGFGNMFLLRGIYAKFCKEKSHSFFEITFFCLWMVLAEGMKSYSLWNFSALSW